SFVEGYGMPVAEAMATGTPVIASDIPSHKEIVGDQATLLDPCDGLGWRAAIEAHAGEYRSKSRHTPQDW
ncbi:glycosyltransferase, partial [Escherichia coli]|uniref:glycosyltransferase n=2 Tax=Pseudomonadota TaxID=1224 RepID=UPI0013D6A0EB